MRSKNYLLFIFSLCIYTFSYSQIKTFEFDDAHFFKIPSGYLIYGNIEDAFTLVKYDNDLNMVSEFSKNILDYKFKRPFFKIYGDHYELVFLKKLVGSVGTLITLDTTLKSIKEEGFTKSDFNENNNFYNSGFPDEKSSLKNVAFYKNKIVSINKLQKKIIIQNINSGLYKNLEQISSYDISCSGDIKECSFWSFNSHLFFSIKTKTEVLSKAFSTGREFPVGELYVGEINMTNNMVKYCTKISYKDLNMDFSLGKMFSGKNSEDILLSGSFLDKEKFNTDKRKDRSEHTGWYILSLDKDGKIGSYHGYNNTDTVFEKIKESLQTNRITNVQEIQITQSGYKVLAEYSSSFYDNGVGGYFKVKQPFGFYVFDLNKDFEIRSSVFYPIKNSIKKGSSFEDIENSNLVNLTNCRKQAFCISDEDFKTITYVYLNKIISIKDGRNYQYIQDILKDDTGNGSIDNANINLVVGDYLSDNNIIKENSTWVYPYNKEKYFLIFWEAKKITFQLIPFK